jgi:hypothetical protein
MVLWILYLMFVRLVGWMPLLSSSSVSKDEERMRNCAKRPPCCGGRTLGRADSLLRLGAHDNIVAANRHHPMTLSVHRPCFMVTYRN